MLDIRLAAAASDAEREDTDQQGTADACERIRCDLIDLELYGDGLDNNSEFAGAAPYLIRTIVARLAVRALHIQSACKAACGGGRSSRSRGRDRDRRAGRRGHSDDRGALWAAYDDRCCWCMSDCDSRKPGRRSWRARLLSSGGGAIVAGIEGRLICFYALNVCIGQKLHDRFSQVCRCVSKQDINVLNYGA